MMFFMLFGKCMSISCVAHSSQNLLNQSGRVNLGALGAPIFQKHVFMAAVTLHVKPG